MDCSRIKGLRAELNMNQEEFAKQIQVSRAAYSLYETGKREMPVDVLLKIAEYFKVSVDYLMGRTDSRKVLK